MFCLILDDSMTIATDSHNCYFSWLSKDWTLDSLIECDAEGYSLAQRTADAIHQVSCSDWCPLATTKNQRQWSSSCWSWLSKSFSISRCLGTFGSFWVSNGTDHARQCHYDWISSFSSSRRERCQHFVYGLRFHLYLHLCLWTLSTGLARGFLGGRKGPLQTVLRVPTKNRQKLLQVRTMTVQRREFWRWRFGAPPTGLSKDCPKNWAFFCHVECTSNCQGWRWWCKLSNIFDVIIVLATNVIPVPWLDQSFQGGWQPKMFNNFRWFSLFFKKKPSLKTVFQLGIWKVSDEFPKFWGAVF